MLYEPSAKPNAIVTIERLFRLVLLVLSSFLLVVALLHLSAIADDPTDRYDEDGDLIMEDAEAASDVSLDLNL